MKPKAWTVAFQISPHFGIVCDVEANDADAALMRAVTNLEKFRPDYGEDANCSILAGRVRVEPWVKA